MNAELSPPAHTYTENELKLIEENERVAHHLAPTIFMSSLSPWLPYCAHLVWGDKSKTFVAIGGVLMSYDIAIERMTIYLLTDKHNRNAACNMLGRYDKILKWTRAYFADQDVGFDECFEQMCEYAGEDADKVLAIFDMLEAEYAKAHQAPIVIQAA